jgi:hypothetical protein
MNYTPKDIAKKDRTDSWAYLTAIANGIEEYKRLNKLWNDFSRMMHYTSPVDKIPILKYCDALGRKVCQLQVNIDFWRARAIALGEPPRVLRKARYRINSR